MRSSPNTKGRGGTIERREYLIDHFRVSFQNGAAWQCLCREFALANSCRHTREAAGMHAAQARIREHIGAGDSGLRKHAARQLREVNHDDYIIMKRGQYLRQQAVL